MKIKEQKDSDIQRGSDFIKLRSSPLLHVFAKYFLFMEQSPALIFTEYVSYICVWLYYIELNIKYYYKGEIYGPQTVWVLTRNNNGVGVARAFKVCALVLSN